VGAGILFILLACLETTLSAKYLLRTLACMCQISSFSNMAYFVGGTLPPYVISICIWLIFSCLEVFSTYMVFNVVCT